MLMTLVSEFHTSQDGDGTFMETQIVAAAGSPPWSKSATRPLNVALNWFRGRLAEVRILMTPNLLKLGSSYIAGAQLPQHPHETLVFSSSSVNCRLRRHT
jgi:hypothetical protein